MQPYLRLELALEAEPVPGGPDRSALAAPLLRRVLGKALIDRFCPFGRPLCEEKPPGAERLPPALELCRLAGACPYGVLFAGSLTARPPYALHVPPLDGSSARVEVTLLGPAWAFYPWVLAALEEALRRGLGKARQRWALREVCRVAPDRRREILAGADLSLLSSTLQPDLLELTREPAPAPGPVRVDLLSPARLLRNGRLLPGGEPVPFVLLIARILDRYVSLYGEDASDLLRVENRSVLQDEAARVPLLSDQTRWIEVRDYSARSGAEMLLGGKVGRLLYGPEAGRFLPILRAGEILHLGKNTASGCGRIQVDLPPITE